MDENSAGEMWVTASAADQGLDAWEQARVLALVNLAMADGVIAGFDTKYRVNRWRPITAIRAGETDGNDETVGDPTHIPHPLGWRSTYFPRGILSAHSTPPQWDVVVT